MPKLRRFLVVPDTHAPYHDKRAWKLMMAAARDFAPGMVVVIGDLADCYAVSSHSKDPARALLFDQEMVVVNTLLDELDALGAKENIFIAGNHCDRLQRYLRDKAPELYRSMSIPQVFRLKERGWDYVPYKEHIKRGKMYFTHDVGVAGRYAVYRCLETFSHSVITGHTHRLAYIVEGSVVGEKRLSAQFGWLGDIKQIDYMSRAKATKDWTLGFGVGYIHPTTGVAYVTPVPIINYTCVVEGRFYKV